MKTERLGIREMNDTIVTILIFHRSEKTYLHSKLLLSTGYFPLTKEDKRSQERPSCREMIGEKEKAII